MTLKIRCLRINFDNLFNTIGTSAIMMEDKMKPENLNHKPYPQAQKIKF